MSEATERLGRLLATAYACRGELRVWRDIVGAEMQEIQRLFSRANKVIAFRDRQAALRKSGSTKDLRRLTARWGRSECKDEYLKKLLCITTKIEHVPRPLIEAKRAQLKLKRLIKHRSAT